MPKMIAFGMIFIPNGRKLPGEFDGNLQKWKFSNYAWKNADFQDFCVRFSNSYSLLNSQITKVFSKKFELYVGGENMSNYKQDKPVLGGYPFGTDFDTSIVYAPIHGSLFYIGLRLKS